MNRGVQLCGDYTGVEHILFYIEMFELNRGLEKLYEGACEYSYWEILSKFLNLRVVLLSCTQWGMSTCMPLIKLFGDN